MLSTLILIGGTVISYSTPDSYFGLDSNCLSGGIIPVELKMNREGNNDQNARLVILDSIPIKNVTVNFGKNKKLIPCGTPFGVKMYCSGAVVVDIQEIKTGNGTFCPASDAGIEKGDIITEINGIAVNSNDDLISMVEESKGSTLKVTLSRENKKMTVNVTPIATNENGNYKIGTWVRDSSAGIGTVTFYDPETGTFGALGHGVCDVDTGALMPLNNGVPVSAEIDGVQKSIRGTAGCLQGHFTNDMENSVISANTEQGLYGYMPSSPRSAEALEVASSAQIFRGKAQILSTVEGCEPELYDIEIEDINYDSKIKSKNLIIKVTDERLIEKTGGIVQGMSGSPIIQDNRLVGAVTHVFVNDPQKGYGITAENMIVNISDHSDMSKAG